MPCPSHELRDRVSRGTFRHVESGIELVRHTVKCEGLNRPDYRNQHCSALIRFVFFALQEVAKNVHKPRDCTVW